MSAHRGNGRSHPLEVVRFLLLSSSSNGCMDSKISDFGLKAIGVNYGYRTTVHAKFNIAKT